MTALGVLGGTFDPVHKAHIACAQSARKLFSLDKVKLIPCAITPHRDQPQRSALHRCKMVELAIANEIGLELDKRECERVGPSYTVDTLASIRDEMNPDDCLIFILGTDAFEHFLSWHKAKHILALSHLLVIKRPGYQLPQQAELVELINQHESKQITEIRELPCGKIFFHEGPLLDISATRIRSYFNFDMPNVSQNIKALSAELPEAVKHYIHEHGLYQERHY